MESNFKCDNLVKRFNDFENFIDSTHNHVPSFRPMPQSKLCSSDKLVSEELNKIIGKRHYTYVYNVGGNPTENWEDRV